MPSKLPNTEYIYLCTPILGDEEIQLVTEVLHSDWVTTVGPQKTTFEHRFCANFCPMAHALAINSGTAALHLAFRLLNIVPGDEILCSTFTFIASISPAVHLGAIPTFIDSDFDSWNMNPKLLEQELIERQANNKLPKAVVVTHVYGQSADLDQIFEICNRYNVALIEDAAEALGTEYKGKQVGFRGVFGIFSFNGNKIVTTGGGGMLVSQDKRLIDHARHLAFQAKEIGLHYVHEELGHNYNLSNVLAAIGIGQLKRFPLILAKKAEIYSRYKQAFENIPGLSMMPKPSFPTTSSNWLSVLRINPAYFPISRDEIILRMDAASIQLRSVWRPLHTQPIFAGSRVIGSAVSEQLFEECLCLPSGLNLTEEDQNHVVEKLLEILENK